MRAWARHADAAFVGQWALTVQSAAKPASQGGGSHYPVLNAVVASSATQCDAGIDGAGVACMPIARDLALHVTPQDLQVDSMVCICVFI